MLLGNRWNVYGPANDEVTWEVAPGRLRDGRVVDVWRETDVVSWDVPTAGLRHGRYRTWPFLTLGGDGGAWDRVCHEYEHRTGNDLVGFHFVMLKARVLEGGAHGPVTQRSIRMHECHVTVTSM